MNKVKVHVYVRYVLGKIGGKNRERPCISVGVFFFSFGNRPVGMKNEAGFTNCWLWV